MFALALQELRFERHALRRLQVRLRIRQQSIHELARFRESIGALEHRDDREQRAGGSLTCRRAPDAAPLPRGAVHPGS